MPIDNLSAARAYQDIAKTLQGGKGTAVDGEGLDFAQMVQTAVRDTVGATSRAEGAALSLAAGQGDIVDVVTAIAAAEAQLETVMAVRDQVIQAYQEILRMPI